MSDPSEDLLVTTEGVDEGSAASTVEGAGSGADGPVTGDSGPGGPGATPAPPVDMETDDSRAAKDLGPGQQLQAGEG